MPRVRRAGGTILCALPLLLAAPAQASGVLEREALRDALRSGATAAQAGPQRLALPAASRSAGRSASDRAPSVSSSIARSPGPSHALVGARTHADVPRLRALLERLGASVETVDALGVLSVEAPSGAALAKALNRHPGVAYVEPDRSLRASVDPFDAPDPAHGNLLFTWAYDEVRAGQALAAAGGGSRRSVAIIDTGLDVTHPDIDGNVGPRHDTASSGGDVTDVNGHGTFVAGLIAAEDGNGIGGKGVAGATKVLPVRASVDGSFRLSDVVKGLAFAIREGADVVNLSLAGAGLDSTSARALDFAFFSDVLPVAASGNLALEGNPVQYPAAFLGGERGGRGIGLSVAATKPGGAPAPFSTHNSRVSVAAPGASDDCRKGVFSTIPRAAGTEWDAATGSPCGATLFGDAGGRWGYAQGTSFAAPIAAGVAAVVWQVEPRLASEQVADVVVRSARQTLPGARWNEFTGSGIVDGEQAAALARRYDVRAPRPRAQASRHGGGVGIRISRSRDRTNAGRELAGRVRYSLFVSRDGGQNFKYAVRPRPRPISTSLRITGNRTNVFVASVCDGNGNCGSKRLGRFRR